MKHNIRCILKTKGDCMEKKFQEELGHEIKKSHKTETIIAFVVLGLFVIGAGVASWWYLDRVPSYNVNDSALNISKKTESAETTSTTSDLKTYINTTFNFSLQYKSNWTLTDKLPTSKTVMGKASETLSIVSPDGYTFTMWVNPDGFGMEGKALYVGYENNTVANGKITLGNRTTGNGLADGAGFIRDYWEQISSFNDWDQCGSRGSCRN
jgi:hypothetical protein